MQGQTLAQYCKTDSALSKEQRRIEREIASFEKNIWGDQARKDSLDSISRLSGKQLKTMRAANRRTERSQQPPCKFRRQFFFGRTGPCYSAQTASLKVGTVYLYKFREYEKINDVIRFGFCDFVCNGVKSPD